MKRMVAGAAVSLLGWAGTPVSAEHPFLDLRRAVPSFAISEQHPDVPWGGRVNTIAVHPESSTRLTVATETGGLFQSEDGGLSWRHLDSFPSFVPVAVAYYSRDPRVLIATTGSDFKTENGGGIWRSADGGATWVRPSGAACEGSTSAFGISEDAETGILYAATDCGVSASADAGAVWIRLPVAGRERKLVAVRALGGGRVVAGGPDGIFYSTDSGGRWRRSDSGAAITSYHAFARIPLSTAGVHAIDAALALSTSSDGGASWRPLPGPPAGASGCGGVAFVRATFQFVWDPFLRPAAMLYVGNRCTLFRRIDSGPWVRADIDHLDTRDLALVAGLPAYLATDGGFHRRQPAPPGLPTPDVFRVAGGGRRGLNALQLYEVTGQNIASPRRHDLYIGTQDNQLRSSADGGRTWPHGTGPEGFFIELARSVASPADSQVLFTSCGPCQSRLSGPHFGDQRDWPDPGGIATGPGYALLGPGTVVQPVEASAALDLTPGLYRTENLGVDWDPLVSIPEDMQSPPQISRDPAGGPVAYIAIRTGSDAVGQLFKVVRVTGLLSGTPRASYPAMNGHGGLGWRGHQFIWSPVFAVDPRDAMHLIAPDPRDDTIKESWDGGESWEPLAEVSELVLRGGTLRSLRIHSLISEIAFHPHQADLVVMGGREGGLYFSQDRGATWRRIPGSDRITNVTAFHWKSLNEVYVSSYGRGLWRVNITWRVLPAAFADLCGDCLIATADSDQPVPRPPGPQDFFAEALFVYEGRLLDATSSGQGLQGVAFTPGAYAYTASASAGFSVQTAERDTVGSFTGIRAALPLFQQGWVLRGFTLSQGQVRHVVVGRDEARPVESSQLVAFVDGGAAESGVLARPYIRVEYEEAHEPTAALLRVRGDRFRPRLPVQVLLDEQPAGTAVADQNGSFDLNRRVAVLPGLHEVRVRQMDGQIVIEDLAAFVVGTADGEGSPQGPASGPGEEEER
jgi:photosystem II stability/assembly factor-like uncharacterized protein